MKIKLLDTDSAEVKQAKQALIDLYGDIMTDVDAKALTMDQVDAKAKATIEGFKVKDGDKEILLTDFIKQLDEAMAKLSAKVANKAKEDDGQPMSFEQAFVKEYKAKEVEIKDAINGNQKGAIVFDLKNITIGENNTILGAGSASRYTLTENTGIISTIRKRALTYLQNVSTGTMAKPLAMWIEEIDETGNPVFIGEGTAKTLLGVRYEERNKIAKKIAVIGKVTTELMDDLPQLMAYIINNLSKRLDIAKETQLITGNDTGENLAGLTTFATQFNGSGLAGTIASANVFDVINAIILQVKKSFGIPNGIFINETFLAQMVSIKSTVGEYTYPMSAFFNVGSDGVTSFLGVRLIGTNALDGTGIDFIGGDLSVVNVMSVQGLKVQIGLDGNDFSNNKKTILLEERLVQFVSANDKQVLVKGTFAAAKTILATT